MDNKNPNTDVSYSDAAGTLLPTSVNDGFDPQALSLEPVPYTSQSVDETKPKSNSGLVRMAKQTGLVALAFLLLGGLGWVLISATREKSPAAVSNLASNYGATEIPLGEFAVKDGVAALQAKMVAINGTLEVNDGLVVSPSIQPANAQPGQIYFDKDSKLLAYYNGSEFVSLPSETGEIVQNVGGLTGAITVGAGLTAVGGQLTNSGVLSIQGQGGNVTLNAGTGIAISGTTITNNGLISITSTSPTIIVDDDGNGNITLSGTGAGTVASPGGTAGRLAKFTGAQTIEDSLITESGVTVTVNGDLSVVTGGLSLSNALTVSNGGTGVTSLAVNGVVIGQGTAGLSAVAAGGPGLCFVSTAGAPTFAACPGGAGVTSLNGLTGAVAIANASGAGATVTIDDASTSAKGIASFNATNFSASSGAINTIQNINSGATPTFAGVNTNTITPGAALTMGISGQTALLQGSTTTITSNGLNNDIVLNSADTIELQDNTNVTGSVGISGDLAVNGGDLTSTGGLNITPGGALAVGASGQQLTLQGNGSTSLRATDSGNTTIVAFTNPVANTTLNFPALAAGTYTICTSGGGCAGAATTLQNAYDNSSNPEIVLDATRGAVTIRDNATPLGANLLEVQNNAGNVTYLAVTSAGLAVTGTATISGNINTSAGTIQTNGTTRIDNSGNLTNIVSLTASGNATLQGGALTLGTNAQAGSVVLSDGSSNTGTLQVAAIGQNTTYTLPDPGSGGATICLDTGNCAGSGGGVTGSGTNDRIAKFTSTGSTVGDSTITDNGTTVTTTVDMVIQGGDVTLGTTGQLGSLVMHDGNGQTTTLRAGDSSGNLTFIFPTNAGSTNQCLKQSGAGNQLIWDACDGGGGGSSTTLQQAYNNGNSITTTDARDIDIVLADTSTDSTLDIVVADNSTGFFSLTRANGVGTNDPAQLMLLDNLDTDRVLPVAIRIQSAAGGISTGIDASDAEIGDALSVGANNIIGTTGNIDFTNFDLVGATGNLTLAGSISGGTSFTGSGNINTSAGTIQTNGTTRIDNSGNLTNIVSLTASGNATLQGGALTLGTNAQAGSVIINDGSSNTGTLQTASLGQNTVYTLPDPGAGSANICLSTGNCAGAGGGVTTSGGTPDTLPVFTGSQALGDSLVSQSGGVVTVNGSLNLTTGNQYTINGTQISSADLSNDANLAKLGSSQTFTGNMNGFRNGTNSTNAFNVQNTAGNRILTVDSSNAEVELGLGSTLDGKLVFSNMSNGNTVTIVPGSPTANRTLTLPDDSGIICLSTGNCAGAGATLQTAYNFSVGGTTPKIKVNSGLGGVDIQDADSTIGANLLNVRASNGSGLGSVLLGVGSTGQLTLQNSSNSTTAFRLLTQGGTTVLTGDTTNGQMILGQSTTLDGKLVFNNATNSNQITLTTAAATGARSITLPDDSGTVCLSSGNCLGGASGGANTALSNLASVAINTTLLPGSSNAIDLGSSTLLFRTLYAATSVQAPLLTTANSTVANTSSLLLRTGTVSTGSSLSSGDISISTGAASGSTSDSGDITIDSGTATGTTGMISLGTANASGVSIGNSSAPLTFQGSQATISTSLAVTGTVSGSTSLNLLSGVLTNSSASGTQQVALLQNAAASGTTEALLALDNADTDTAVTAGLKVTSAAGTITTGIDVSGSNITTAISVGANPISGTTGSISFTNFNLNGTTGTLRLSGTGTESFAGNTGNVPAKINVPFMDPGASGQIIAVGLPSSTVSSSSRAITAFDARSGGHQPTIGVMSPDESAIGGFTWEGTNDSFYIKNTAAAGSIVLGSAVGTVVQGALNNTAGAVSFTGATTGDALTVTNSTSTGNIAVFRDNATTVATIADGGGVNFTNSTNSATALVVQNATAADTLFTIDTAARSGSGGNRVKIGNSTGTDGNLTLLQLDAATADPTSNLSALNGGLFYNSTSHKVSLIENGVVKIICNTTDLGCGTGTVTQQLAYNNSTGGTTPEIKLDSTRGALDIQDADSTLGANLFNVRGSNGSGLGSILFGVGSTGAVSVSNNLTVGGEINGATYSGGGLTDCDAQNSKVLWDSTTETFSCGTDRASVGIRKPSDESRTSDSTVSNDGHFLFSVGANETWAFEIQGVLHTSATAGFKLAFTAPSGSTCVFASTDLYDVQNNNSTTCGGAGITQNATDTVDHPFLIFGTIVTGGTGGTVRMQWAQGTSNGTPTVIEAGSYLVAYKLSGADLAEAYYTKDNSIGPGHVVRVDGSLKAGVQKTTGAYDEGALGIVSTQPGIILGEPTAAAGAGKPVLLALAGRVPVRVSLENGPIKAGDYLTSSSTPGVAMKAIKPGQMIGKALEDFSSSNPNAEGMVMTFANLTWANPNTGVTADNTLQAGAISAASLNVSGAITTDNLVVTGAATVKELVVGSLVSTKDITVSGTASFAGDIQLMGVGQSRNAITKRFKASVPVAIGAVVIADPDKDGQVTTTSVEGDTRVLGVALTEAHAAGDEITVAIGGSVQVNTVFGAAIQGGDLLVSSSQAGFAQEGTTPLPGSVVGKALGKPDGDLTWMLITLD